MLKWPAATPFPVRASKPRVGFAYNFLQGVSRYRYRFLLSVLLLKSESKLLNLDAATLGELHESAAADTRKTKSSFAR